MIKYLLFIILTNFFLNSCQSKKIRPSKGKEKNNIEFTETDAVDNVLALAEDDLSLFVFPEDINKLSFNKEIYEKTTSRLDDIKIYCGPFQKKEDIPDDFQSFITEEDDLYYVIFYHNRASLEPYFDFSLNLANRMDLGGMMELFNSLIRKNSKINSSSTTSSLSSPTTVTPGRNDILLQDTLLFDSEFQYKWVGLTSEQRIAFGNRLDILDGDQAAEFLDNLKKMDENQLASYKRFLDENPNVKIEDEIKFIDNLISPIRTRILSKDGSQVVTLARNESTLSPPPTGVDKLGGLESPRPALGFLDEIKAFFQTKFVGERFFYSQANPTKLRSSLDEALNVNKGLLERLEVAPKMKEKVQALLDKTPSKRKSFRAYLESRIKLLDEMEKVKKDLGELEASHQGLESFSLERLDLYFNGALSIKYQQALADYTFAFSKEGIDLGSNKYFKNQKLLSKNERKILEFDSGKNLRVSDNKANISLDAFLLEPPQYGMRQGLLAKEIQKILTLLSMIY